jgi:GNAT superfamily N-acetyltransferase
MALELDVRVVGETDITACFALMRALRPQLSSEAEFVERWRRQSEQGYSILALWRAQHAVALAGFRVQENFVHGRFLYVDDLVADESERRQGHGARLRPRLSQACPRHRAREHAWAPLLLSPGPAGDVASLQLPARLKDCWKATRRSLRRAPPIR